ncbi:MAG: hypothetical protein ACYCOR_21025 [Acidobacteriaceae bacterium]
MINSKQHIEQAQNQAAAMLARRFGNVLNEPIPSAYLSILNAREGTVSDAMVKSFESGMRRANAVSKAFRSNTRAPRFPTSKEIVKANPELAKANLDVGTLSNFSQITGGQSLGYVSLDTQMARGTVRPNSFTLYNALHKSAAYQVVDFWPYASATGGKLPGGAFGSYSSVSSGALNTNAGEYELKSITLKLALDGRAITTALAAQNSFVNVVEQENTNAALSVLESINWANYWGDSTLFPNMYDGINKVVSDAYPQNVIDFQQYASAQSSSGLSNEQLLFNLMYEQAAQITAYRQYGHITHNFMSPSMMGALQSLVTTLLNNVVTTITQFQADGKGIVVNGDLQGMNTRFGAIQFPIDLFITARDKPSQAIVFSESGTSQATTVNPTPPASVTVASGAVSAQSEWTTAWLGSYTYAVASTDEAMNESVLTYSAATTALTAGEVYVVTINPPAANDMFAFRVFRSGLGYTLGTGSAPGAFRYVGAVAASGSAAVTFTDYNTHIPGSETVFMLDMDEADMALDFRYLLPLSKIELFANNLYMPWAVAMIGAVRVKVPKFHGIIKNIVVTNPEWNPLASNA